MNSFYYFKLFTEKPETIHKARKRVHARPARSHTRIYITMTFFVRYLLTNKFGPSQELHAHRERLREREEK